MSDDTKRSFEGQMRDRHAPGAPRDVPLVGKEPFSNASEYSFFLDGLTEDEKGDTAELYPRFQEDFKANKEAYEAKMAVANAVYAEAMLAYWRGHGSSEWIDVMKATRARIAETNAGASGGGGGGLTSSGGMEGSSGDTGAPQVSAEAVALFADSP